MKNSGFGTAWHYARALGHIQSNEIELALLRCERSLLGRLSEALAVFIGEHPDHTLRLAREIDEQKFANAARFDDWVGSLREAGMPE